MLKAARVHHVYLVSAFQNVAVVRGCYTYANAQVFQFAVDANASVKLRLGRTDNPAINRLVLAHTLCSTVSSGNCVLFDSLG